MPVLPIVRLGHPSLRVRSRTVTKSELKSTHFQRFIDDLAETCIKNRGAGIASPQVAVNKRVIVVHVDPENSRYPGRPPFPLTIVVNPKITRQSQKIVEDWEGDLSVNIRALVPRSFSCTVEGWDRYGSPIRLNLVGFHARVFQHEIDHLDGIFLIDRVVRRETLSEVAEWEQYWQGRDVRRVLSVRK